MNEIAKPRRCWLRFSLRFLLVLLTAIAFGLGWIARTAAIQRTAAGKIVDRGGWVDYDCPGVELDRWVAEAVRSWTWTDNIRSWLGSKVGIDYVANVTRARVGAFAGDTPDNPEFAARSTDLCDIQPLLELPKVKFLVVRGQLNDDALDEIVRLRTVESLDLQTRPLTKPQLERLATMRTLRSLAIGNMRGNDISILQRMTHLRTLTLLNPYVLDAELDQLKATMPNTIVVCYYAAIP